MSILEAFFFILVQDLETLDENFSFIGEYLNSGKNFASMSGFLYIRNKFHCTIQVELSTVSYNHCSICGNKYAHLP